MKKGTAFFIIISMIICIFTAGCQNSHGLNPKNPVTITMWHNYGGQMKVTMDEMVEEFNATVGAEKGIIINVTSISSSASLQDKLIMAAKGDPGAPALPDIATAYPKTAVILADKGLLVNLDEQFTSKELTAYVPRFIEEGRLETEKLYVFPTAKSTEVIFLNKTIFDRFAKETGAAYSDLQTFEGLAKTAALYYKWTDDQTPTVANDGKTFYHTDSLFNFTQVGCKQLGKDFIVNNKPDYSSEAYRKVWGNYYEQAVQGYYAIYDGYASDLAKTGDIVCSTGSTAGVAFFDPQVTYADNTSEPAELMILPYPTFEGGKKIAVQRGSGMLVTKSNEAKEYAASIFLKWFTNPGNNLRFVASTGYLPVTEEAYGKIMSDEIEKSQDVNIRKLLTTAVEMQGQYDYYIPPLFDGIDALQKDYEKRLKQVALTSRKSYENMLGFKDKNAALAESTKGVFQAFIK